MLFQYRGFKVLLVAKKKKKTQPVSDLDEPSNGRSTWVPAGCLLSLNLFKQSRMGLLLTSYLLHILGMVKARGTSKKCKYLPSLLQHSTMSVRTTNKDTPSDKIIYNGIYWHFKYTVTKI